MHAVLRKYLAFLARLLIKKHKPYVIGVTGTVWKTTTTHNIATLFCTAFWENAVEISKYNYNWEFWFPLSIIGEKTGWKNLFLWMKVAYTAMIRYFRPYPRYLILEYGIDHPGEMDFLLSIATPDIAIVTPIEPNHIEQFQKFENYRKEKLKILAYAKKAVVHESLAENVPVDTPLYGFSCQESMQVQDMKISEKGTTAFVKIDEIIYEIYYPSVGFFLIENLLSLLYIAHKMHIDKEKIQESMKSMKVRKWRWKLLKWINNSLIIDGSYNGGYLSIKTGLESLVDFFETKNIVLVLGDMRELWPEEEKLHLQLADDIIRIFQDCPSVQVFLVGPMMRKYVFPKIADILPTKSALSSREIGEYVKSYSDEISEKEVFYVKWSQNTIFLEEAIKMWISEDDFKNLPRQDEKWLAIKNEFFESVEKGIL